MNDSRIQTALRVVVAGEFQIGKSSLVNCLLARDVAETGEGYFPTTDVVAEYELAPGIRIVDSPGFDDTRGEVATLSAQALRSADVVVFVKTEKTLGDRDRDILRMANGGPILVLFNCSDKTLGRNGWLPDLPKNGETCAKITVQLERDGMSSSVLTIGGKTVFPINILWAQYGLGMALSEKQIDYIESFAGQQLGLFATGEPLRAEMLRRSGFLPVRNFLKNLPIELLKHIAANPRQEIGRAIDRFSRELKTRWAAA